MRLRAMFTAALTGAMLVGSVWAGAGLTPVRSGADLPVEEPKVKAASALSAADIGEGVELGADEALIGAAKVSIYPTPDASKGEVWVKDKTKCTPATSGDVQTTADHVADWRTPWIENTNCIYMGGFGIGPSQPVLEWDTEYGLWSRSVAIARDGGTAVLTILDGEGYFGKYGRMCGATPCGAFDLSEQLAAEINAANPDLGVTPASFVFASTHAHSAMDFIGGWGGVPQWYMDQVAEAMRDSVRMALSLESCEGTLEAEAECVPMQPATIEVGDTLARGQNGERRDTYHSAEDPTVNWFRAVGRNGDVIATVGSFAAHATSFGSSATKAHADWPGVFSTTVEQEFGGIGLMFEAGLGNMSSRGGAMMGKTLADLIPAVGAGALLPQPTVRAKQTFWDQPVTNVPLGSLGAAGFFDRPFGGPASVEGGKSGVKPCRSSGPTSVRVAVSAIRIGAPQLKAESARPDLVIAAAPGEIFSNYSNTIEERARLGALAIGQANDALGYMPQQFETDYAAREGLGFAGAGFFEYEDAYSIDHCFGEIALNNTLRAIDQLRAPID